MRVSKAEGDKVAIWRARIQRARDARDEFTRRADRNLQYYVGRHWPDLQDSMVAAGYLAGDDNDRVTVNKTYAYIAAQVPSMYYTDPQFTTSARIPIPEKDQMGQVVLTEDGHIKDKSWKIAQSQQHALNYVFGEVQGSMDLRLAILSGFLGMGVVKTGATGSLVRVNPNDSDLTEEERDDENVVVASSDYFCDWVPWNNMLFDCEAGNLFKNHRYVIEEWVRPLSFVQNYENYKGRRSIEATDRVGAVPGDDVNYDRTSLRKHGEMLTQMMTSDAADLDALRVRGYDIYDFENDEMLVLPHGAAHAPGVNDFFINKDQQMPDGLDHGPYSFLKMVEIPGEWYPMTTTELLIPLQQEYNETRTMIRNHKRRAVRKFLYTDDFLGDDEEGAIDSLRSGEDNEFVKVGDIHGVGALEQPGLDSAFAASIQLMQNDFNEIGGQGGAARGVADADSATEASILESHLQTRESDMRDNIVAPFVASVGRKLFQSMQANMTVPMWARMADPHGAGHTQFKSVTPQEIIAAADINIVPGSTAPKNGTWKREIILNLMARINQGPGILGIRSFTQRLLEVLDMSGDLALENDMVAYGQAAQEAENARRSGENQGGDGAADAATQLQAIVGGRG